MRRYIPDRVKIKKKTTKKVKQWAKCIFHILFTAWPALNTLHLQISRLCDKNSQKILREEHFIYNWGTHTHEKYALLKKWKKIMCEDVFFAYSFSSIYKNIVKNWKNQRNVLMATANSYTSKDGSQFRGTEYATTFIAKQDFVDRITQLS